MVSHVPHLLAYALTAATARRAQAGEPVCELAAGSWHGATRVAASGAQLWREILLSNRGAALAALADFRGELDRLSDALERGDAAALEALLAAARLCKEACGPPPAGRRGCEDPV
jgi:prephenate dehydrogenase